MRQTSVRPNDTVQVAEDVIFRELDGETVLLNLETGIYFGLNAVGTRMWNLLQEHASVEKALEVLVREYDATPECLERDLLELTEELREKGLIRVSSSHA